MATVVVTFKLMPESPEVDFSAIESSAVAKIDAFVGESKEKKIEKEPIAFGLTALRITFVMDESLGSTDDLEADVATIDGVAGVDVVDVRRTIG